MERDDIHEFIRRVRPSLIQQLQLDVVAYLYEKKLLSSQDYMEISEIEGRQNQIICLLDKLPSKSKDCFLEFKQWLIDWYEWIVEEHNLTYHYEGRNNNFKEVMKVLSASEVPALPPQHVSRTKEFSELNNHLHQMSRGEYVVVHGMGGCGKSTLVIEVLQKSPSLVLDTFKSKIFWLTVGRESALKKDIEQEKVRDLTILQELYTRLFIGRGYNTPPLPLDMKSAKRVLEEKLRESDLEDCLLILDDVPSSDFIKCLNIGCKILVTTDDKNVMNKTNNPIYLVKVSEGFTEDESLTLFANNLACCKSNLPSQAKHIHALCKGFPLTISLVASQLAEFKEDVLSKNDRWDVYIDHLKIKDIESAIGRFDRYRLEQISLLYKALDMSINNLDPCLQSMYQDFALFMDDVNIKPEVLSTLWDLPKKEVEDIMLEFDKKCLVIRTWNGHLSSYVYCVHDLLLDYLKRKLSTSEKKSLHRKFITSYHTKYGDTLSFPSDDNYIFLYLGYHLKEAEYFYEFPKLYLDLKFIECKIMAHGPADVLYDYKKYKSYIANTEENLKIYEEYTDFISRIGVSLLISRADIVQFGLAWCKDSYVYKSAAKLAKKSYKKYFDYLTDTPKDCSSPEVHHYREAITAAIFFDRNIIVANLNNTIKLIDLKTKQSIITFQGHTDRVTHLQLSPNKLFFLSVGRDSVICMWSLYYLENTIGKPRTPSPQLTQPHWKDAFDRQRSSNELPVLTLQGHQNRIVDVQFSPRGSLVVSSGEDKRVIIWNLALERSTMKLSKLGREKKINVDEVAVSCRFTHEEDFLICASASGMLSIYDVSNKELKSTVRTNSLIKSIAIIPETPQIQVLIMGDDYLTLNNISRQSMSNCTLQSSHRYNTLNRKRHDNCICAAVSHDGKYVAIASTNYDLLIREVKTLKEVTKFHETNGKINALNWSDDNQALMATYQNPVWKIWNLEIGNVANTAVKLKQSVFDATWVAYPDSDSEEDGLLITAALDVENNINIFYDLRLFKTITEKPSGAEQISHLCLSECQKDSYVVYACKTGSVHLIMLEKWTSFSVLNANCLRVCKMKLFYYEDTLLVLLLVEKVAGKFSLLGWIKNNNHDDEISGDVVEYVKENPSIIDFNADIKNASVYAVQNNHSCDVFDLKGAKKDFLGYDAVDEFVPAKFVDFSNNFDLMATGNEKQVVLTNMKTNKRIARKFDALKANVCKFSYDGKYLAVGFTCGTVQIYENANEESLIKFSDQGTNVIDLTWSPVDYRLIVVLDRDVALCKVSPGNCSLISIVNMSVDKVLFNTLFTKIVTVDSSGHFHVLKHPGLL